MLECDVIKSDSFSGVRCGRAARIDNALSPEMVPGTEVNSKLIYLNSAIDEVRSG